MNYRETIYVPQREIDRINELIDAGKALYLRGEEINDEIEETLRQHERGAALGVKQDGETYDEVSAQFEDGRIVDVKPVGGQPPFVDATLYEPREDSDELRHLATAQGAGEALDGSWFFIVDGDEYTVTVEPEEGQ